LITELTQAPIIDGLSFDPFALFDDGWAPAKVGVGKRDVVQAPVVTLVMVMLDERFDLAFQIIRQEVVLEAYAVFEGLMPAFDFALRLRAERYAAANMAHAQGFDIISQFASDVAGAHWTCFDKVGRECLSWRLIFRTEPC
jgi:hypothetical protein